MSEKKLSRRDFLKGSAAAAAALAAGTLVGSSALAAESEEISWDREYDVVIAGAGGTGVCAAAAAKEAGAEKVIVFEKAGIMGGTTNFSGGVMQAAGTRYQKEFSDFQDDTPEKHAAEWLAEGEGYLDEALVTDLANGLRSALTGWRTAVGSSGSAFMATAMFPM